MVNIFLRICWHCSFDLIYDAIGNEEIADSADRLLRPFSGATYVSIVIPFLRNVDVNGMVFGLAKSACQLSTSVTKVFSSGCVLKPVSTNTAATDGVVSVA